MAPVRLYVYDLSNGLARQLSLQMTGKQIDGIWHTSVVVFGQEIFYGQGINITSPGMSHHGTPSQILDMGETALDEETFQQYLEGIREHYTADKYHLLEFNCNSFTNDCVGFLTGGSIPAWIKDLPQDFLSSPLGAALRPTIDRMFGRPSASTTLPSPTPEMASGSSLLRTVASQAVASPSTQAYPTPTPTPSHDKSALTSPISITTNPASFSSLITSRRCVTAFFTSATCPPCRIVEPVFEDLARENVSDAVAFAKTDIGTGLGGQIASQWGIRATPTFLFFLDGKKVHELKGADAGELRTQVKLLIFQAFPPHPHTSMSFPAIRGISLRPIVFSQIPNWDAALGKLNSSIDAIPSTNIDRAHVRRVLMERVVPYLRARFPAQGQSSSLSTSPLPADIIPQWSSVTMALCNTLSPPEIFPLVDFWRVGLLDTSITSVMAGIQVEGTTDVTGMLLQTAVDTLEIGSPSPRNLLLTTLRLLTNAFMDISLARHLLDPTARPSRPGSSRRGNITALLVSTLLHADGPVRIGAASLAFNIAAHYQAPLVEAQKRGRRGDVATSDDGECQGEWEVEIVSAIVEALAREKQSEDVVHRLTAALALFLHLSPYWNQLSSLVEVLQVKDILGSKLLPGGCGDKGVQKKEVRSLLKEVGAMCP